jgi:hypothetical protein
MQRIFDTLVKQGSVRSRIGVHRPSRRRQRLLLGSIHHRDGLGRGAERASRGSFYKGHFEKRATVSGEYQGTSGERLLVLQPAKNWTQYPFFSASVLASGCNDRSVASNPPNAADIHERSSLLVQIVGARWLIDPCAAQRRDSMNLRGVIPLKRRRTAVKGKP